MVVILIKVNSGYPASDAGLKDGDIVTKIDGEDVTTESLLKSGLQQDVPASDLVINGRYLIYYNRCTNNYQLINSYPATTSTSTVESTQEG